MGSTEMKLIDLTTWKRRDHYELYWKLDYPYLNVTTNLARSIGERFQSRVKFMILCFIMIAFIASCTSGTQQATEVEIGTATSQSAELPTSTTAPIEIPTQMPTQMPTQIPTVNVPPTATAEPELIAPEYPPTNAEFTGTINFSLDQLQTSEDKTLPGEATMLSWMPMTLESGEVVAVNMVIQDIAEGSIFFSLGYYAGAASPNERFVDGEFQSPTGPWGADGMIAKLAERLNIIGKNVKFNFITGNNSQGILLEYNPLDKLLSGKLGNQMVAFGESQNLAYLKGGPTVNYQGKQIPLVIVYRMNLLEIIGEAP